MPVGVHVSTPVVSTPVVGKPGRRGRAGGAPRPGRVHVPGAASAAVRPLLEAPRRPARVLAAFPAGVYLEVRTEPEPTVIAVITGEAVRLPNAVLLAGALPRVEVGEDAWVGERGVDLGPLSLRVRRWWDPAPPLGRVDPAGLEGAAGVLAAPAGPAPGLAGNGAVAALAAACGRGWLLGMATAAEELVGLGPGLTPSGDDVLAGLLVTLRHLGTATGAGRAVWLAGWLAATVTFDARSRTTPLSAALLHCAARGEACPEVIAVLRGVAGRQPLGPALRRLRRLGHTSGADLAQGVAIGVDAVLDLGGHR
ncbi:DUF2877 domain-containing protein [Actinomadura sp. ATCC 31491]|uniref:DUF2877 domain-containing protein n=1 Tax=Actinomadura luzonensis TaxID=2805427 RepID=A0ABT0FYJ4_9ACTN|nr:DUF2877 domain-containing protein [Actinomadura luzonensis]MCK2217415.1 DUF2877 domain-containing protein [Actinomadura luzonensis]